MRDKPRIHRQPAGADIASVLIRTALALFGRDAMSDMSLLCARPLELMGSRPRTTIALHACGGEADSSSACWTHLASATYPRIALLLMRQHEFVHAAEFEIDVRKFSGMHGGAEPLFGVPPVDPA